MPNRFFQGRRKSLQGRLRPLFPPGYGPVSNSFKVCPTHFCKGAENFFSWLWAWFCPIDRLATVEALKMNVHLLLLWLATLQISATVCECLRKRHNWSVSIRFNSQLRVWVTRSGAVRGGPGGTLFWGPTATEGPEAEGQARDQLETPRGRRVSWDGHNFFNYVQ